MDTSQALDVDGGFFTTAGIKPVNEDCADVCIPENEHDLSTKGICALVADGVSTAEAGKQASETSVSQFVNDYYDTPDTWSVSHCGEKILSGINLKLYRLSHDFKVEGKGYLCTFSAAVIKSTTAHLFHVGDSRIYLYRDNQLTQLTHDHTVVLSASQEYLSRAMGMDNRLNIDYKKVPLKNGDVLMCSSDGVHGFLSDEQIANALQKGQDEKQSAQQTSQYLCDEAGKYGSDDNITAVVVNIHQLKMESIDDFNSRLTRLPFPPALSPGYKIDGFEVISEIYASARSQLYKVKDIESGRIMVMKTPSVNFEEDNHYIDRFIQEEWIGKRIHSPYVVKVINISREKHFLYYLLEWVEGETLTQWISKNPQPDATQAINIVEQIAAGLQAFHKNDSTHQDLRPSNIMITDGRIKIVDFGSVFVAGVAEIFLPIKHEGALGTASYADPLYLQGRNSGSQGDLYSLATICYEIFTGQLPFGDKIDDCQTSLDYDRLRYRPSDELNPIIPIWFDRALQRALKFDLNQRYITIGEFIKDLKYPNQDFLRDDPKQELTSSPILFWQVMCGVWIITLLAMVVLFSNG